MRGGLSGVVATAARGAAAFAKGARTNLMIFFSFAFIPSPRYSLAPTLSLSLAPSLFSLSFTLFLSLSPRRRRALLLPYQGVTAYSPTRPLLPGRRKGRRPTVGRRGRARAVRIPVTNAAAARGSAAAAGWVGGPGPVGRVCAAGGGTHSLSLNCTNMQFYFLGFYPLVVYC